MTNDLLVYDTHQVHVLGDPWQRLSHKQVCERAALLHHLQPAHDVALGVGEGLALLDGDKLGNLTLKLRNNMVMIDAKS